MIFYNSLYKIITSEKTGTGHAMTLEMEHTHPLFKGHFPGSPVLPGVVLLQIIRECVENSFSKAIFLEYKDIQQCKFPMPIVMENNRNIRLDFSIQGDDASLFRLNATVKDEQTVFAVLKAGLAVSF